MRRHAGHSIRVRNSHSPLPLIISSNFYIDYPDIRLKVELTHRLHVSPPAAAAVLSPAGRTLLSSFLLSGSHYTCKHTHAFTDTITHTLTVSSQVSPVSTGGVTASRNLHPDPPPALLSMTSHSSQQQLADGGRHKETERDKQTSVTAAETELRPRTRTGAWR